jgi:phage terminase small subunit
MTPKQEQFVREYLIDLNATQAAIRAGYSAKTAKVIGHENLTKPDVQDAIAAAQQERAKRTGITQDRVLQELGRIAFFDLRKLYREDGSLKAMHELDDDAAAVLAGVDVVEMAGGAAIGGPEGGIVHVPMYTKKAKIPDKVAALGLAMRHLGMLKDKTELSGPDGGPMEVREIRLVAGVGRTA